MSETSTGGRSTAMAPKAVVLIAGNAHSGSTMVDLTIGSTPGAFSVGEVEALYHPFRPYHLKPTCRCGRADCSLRAKLDAVRARDFHANAMRISNHNTIVDSSKSLVWMSDSHRWAARAGLQVAMVAVWKTPYEAVKSVWKRRPTPDGLAAGLRAWLYYYPRLLEARWPMVTVNHAALSENRESVSRQIVESIGLSWAPVAASWWSIEHHHLFGSQLVADQMHQGRPVSASNRDFSEFDVQWSKVDSATRQRLDHIAESLAGHDVSSVSSFGGALYQPADHTAPPWGFSRQRLRRYERQFRFLSRHHLARNRG